MFLNIIAADADRPILMKNQFPTNFLNWADIENIVNNYMYFTPVELINESNQKVFAPLINLPWVKNARDPEFVINSIAKGNTFIITKLNRYNSSLNHLCHQIENMIKGNCDVHAYCGLTDNAVSFHRHSDNAYNLIIQQDGTCHWKVWMPDQEQPYIDTVLEPGDAIYIPKSYSHECTPIGKRLSLSLRFEPGKRLYRNWLKLNSSNENN